MSQELLEAIRWGYVWRLYTWASWWLAPVVPFAWVIAMWATTNHYEVRGWSYLWWACGLLVPLSIWAVTTTVIHAWRPERSPAARLIARERPTQVRAVEVRKAGSRFLLRF